MRLMLFIVFASSLPFIYPMGSKRTIYGACPAPDTSLAKLIETAEAVLKDQEAQELEKFEQTVTLSINCPQCAFQADTIALAKHLNKVHLLPFKEWKLYLCPLCPVKGRSPVEIKRHIKTKHLGIKDFYCTQCGDAFPRKYSLESHIAAVHDKIRDEKCPHCPHITAERSNMTKHIERIHGKIEQPSTV